MQGHAQHISFADNISRYIWSPLQHFVTIYYLEPYVSVIESYSCRVLWFIQWTSFRAIWWRWKRRFITSVTRFMCLKGLLCGSDVTFVTCEVDRRVSKQKFIGDFGTCRITSWPNHWYIFLFKKKLQPFVIELWLLKIYFKNTLANICVEVKYQELKIQ